MSAPTPFQATAVARLDALFCRPRWVVDAYALDADAHEPCENDSDHGPGIVYGGPCNGMCLECAIKAIALEHRDPAGSDHLSLSVLRVTWGMTFRPERVRD